jgi:programmed cell death protein 5
MDELEDIRRRKLDEIQRRQIQQQLQEEAQLQRQVEQLEQIVRQNLTKEALQRYGNLKTAHPEKAVQLLVILAQLIQNGAERIDDEMMKKILVRLTPQKKEFKINRK